MSQKSKSTNSNCHRKITLNEAKWHLNKNTLKALIEITKEEFIYFDKDSRIIDIANKTIDFFGCKRDHVIGKKIKDIDFFTPMESKQVMAFFNNAMAGNIISSIVFEIRNKFGEPVVIEANTAFVYEGKKQIGLLSIMKNITVCGEAEKARRKSEAKFKMIFENANDIIVYVNPQGVIMDANNKVKEIGYTLEEIIGKKFTELEIFSPKELERGLNDLKKTLSGKPIDMLEYEILNKNKMPVHVEVTSQMIKKDGRPEAIINIIRDITTRKRVEEAIRKSEKKLRTIFENVNDLIIVTDRAGNFVDLNKKVEALYGWAREECIGKNFSEFPVLKKEDILRCQQYFKNIMSGKKTEIIILKTFARDKSIIYVEVNPIPVYEDNEIQWVICIIRDTTERREIEESLQNYRNHFEELLNKHTRDLQETNIALKVLIERREEDKVELEEKIFYNINKMILPFLNKLKMCHLNKHQANYTDIIEKNLKDIISPFTKRLSAKQCGLTPTEIQIANLIKQGKSTKEIAEIYSLSPGTIKAHRNNIRKKLNIKNEKKNLTTYLLNL